jgi:MFS family permease
MLTAAYVVYNRLAPRLGQNDFRRMSGRCSSKHNRIPGGVHAHKMGCDVAGRHPDQAVSTLVREAPEPCAGASALSESVSPAIKGPTIPADASEPPFPRAVVAWAAVAVLFVLSIVAFLDRLIVSLMVPMIKADFGVSDSQIALMQGAAFSLVYALAAFPFGYAVDRCSRRVTLFVGVFLWALAATASGLAGSFNTLLAARLGVGLGEAALSPVVASILSDMFPKRRLAFAFSVVSVGALIGTQGALIVGGLVLAWAGDGMTVPVLGFLAPWKIAFLVTGLPGLLLAFIVFLIPEPVRRMSSKEGAPAKARWSDFQPFLKEHGGFVACYIGAFTALGTGSYALLMWAPTVLQRVHHLTPRDTGLTLGPISLACGLVGTLGAGLIVDHIYSKGRRDAHAIYYSVAGVLLVVLGLAAAWAPTPWLYLACLAPMKLLLNFSGVALAGLQVMTPAHLRGRVAALYAFCTVLVGSTIGPSAVAFFTDYVFRDESKLHWSVAAVMAIFGSLAAILLTLVRAPMRRVGEAAPSPAAEPGLASG